jgi:drug/metabolite transporter (DMT)-like permease
MAVKRQSPNCGRSPSVLLEKPSDESSSPPPLRKAVAKKEKMSSIPRTRTPMTPMTRIGRGKRERSRFSQNLPRDLLIAIPTWYIVGVGSICTTNILMNEYSLPPLVLTFQQLAIGSTLLRLHLHLTGGLQPLPKDDKQKRQSIYFDFVLAGLFNALDFLATNTCFSHSSASFVETIKASEPLTTTAIALFFGIDTLSGLEAICIVVLVSGVFLSTMANASGSDHQGQADFHQSVKTTLVVMTANLCFALRAKSQKMFRTYPEGEKLDDENLLMRMEQIGALSMALPVIIFELPGILERGLNASFEKHCHYWALAVMNAACFCTYW